jgi:hypothetical protein
VNKKAYESGQIKQAAQDGNHEFVTLIACVSATGEAVPLTLLDKSASGDLQDTWMEDVEEGQQAFFGYHSGYALVEGNNCDLGKGRELCLKYRVPVWHKYCWVMTNLTSE